MVTEVDGELAGQGAGLVEREGAAAGGRDQRALEHGGDAAEGLGLLEGALQQA